MAGNAGNWYKLPGKTKGTTRVYISAGTLRAAYEITDPRVPAPRAEFLADIGEASADAQTKALLELAAESPQPAGQAKRSIVQFTGAVKAYAARGPVDATIRKLLGRTPSVAEIARLIGAPDGSQIVAQAVAYGEDIQGDAILGDSVVFTVTHPSLEVPMWRELIRHVTTRAPFLSKQGLILIPEAPPGTGSRLFASQAKEAAALGIETISTYAESGPGKNGYYTWPRIGYNAPLSGGDRYMLRKASDDPDVYNAPDLITLFAQPGGAAAWKQVGTERKMTFDTAPDSPSQRALADYLAVKGWDR